MRSWVQLEWYACATITEALSCFDKLVGDSPVFIHFAFPQGDVAIFSFTARGVIKVTDSKQWFTTRFVSLL